MIGPQGQSTPTVVVEYDGEYWHGKGSHRGPRKQAIYDARKANDLREQGFIVGRVRVGDLPTSIRMTFMYPNEVKTTRV